MVHNDPSAHAIPATGTDAATAIPVASMVESIVGCKWSVGLLRASTGLSAKVMNERLRKMLRFGIVEEVRRLQEAVDSGAISESAAIRKEAAPRGRLTARR